MIESIYEVIRVLSVFLIFMVVYRSGKDEEVRAQKGWHFFVCGFALLLFGAALEVSGNFIDLDRHLVLGGIDYKPFLEKIIGFMCGFLLLAIGFYRWIPMVSALRSARRELDGINQSLEQKIQQRTEQLRLEIQIREEMSEKREKLITELNVTLDELKLLKGILPICSYCKKIRDDEGYWEQVETYISRHSEAEFSHGICPECMETRQLFSPRHRAHEQSGGSLQGHGGACRSHCASSA